MTQPTNDQIHRGIEGGIQSILRIIFRFSPVIAHSIECNIASDDYLKANCYGSHRQHIRDEMYRRKLLCISCSLQDHKECLYRWGRDCLCQICRLE